MSWDFYTITTPIAKRDYYCDASDYVIGLLNEGIFSFTELRLIAKANKDGWKIKKGQKYSKIRGKFEGEWATFRARPEIDQVCFEHEIYQN